MKKSMIAMLALAVTAFVVLTGFHGGCGSETPEGRAKMIKRMSSAKLDGFLDDLDATDVQRKRMHEVKDEIVAEVLPLIEDHQKVKAELRSEWNAETPDAAKIHATLDGRIDAVRRLLHKVADGAIELHQLLTPAQRAQISKRWK